MLPEKTRITSARSPMVVTSVWLRVWMSTPANCGVPGPNGTKMLCERSRPFAWRYTDTLARVASGPLITPVLSPAVSLLTRCSGYWIRMRVDSPITAGSTKPKPASVGWRRFR